MSNIRSQYIAILNLEKERNLALEEMSEILGFDVTFSDEMIIKNATDLFLKQYTKEMMDKLAGVMNG